MRQHPLTRFGVRAFGTLAMIVALHGLVMVTVTGSPWHITQAALGFLMANLALLYIKAPAIAERRHRRHAAHQAHELAEVSFWEVTSLPRLTREVTHWQQHLNNTIQNQTDNNAQKRP